MHSKAWLGSWKRSYAVAGPKSVILSMEITVAERAHGCRSDKTHRIARGMRRLTVKQDRAKQNYCLTCAKKILARGVARLSALHEQVEALLGMTNNSHKTQQS
jgi:hypothetical protein